MQPKSPKPYDTITLNAANSDLHFTSEQRRAHTTSEVESSESNKRNWKTPFLLLWLIANLPFVSYAMWRALTDLQEKDWISLACRTRRLHKVGFKTRTTRYWLAISYSNLNQWGKAVEVFEKMSRPLETVADDVARYCAHVWALANLGRVEEASELPARQRMADGNRPASPKTWGSYGASPT